MKKLFSVSRFSNLAKRQNAGFTLIEILVVIGIIALLATIVIVAINPAKQFAQARNTQRTSNVNSILNAIGQRIADNKGVFAGVYTIGAVTYTCGTLPAASTTITTGNSATAGDLGCLVPSYIPQLPSDPTIGTPVSTGYKVDQDAAGRVTVCAPESALETSLPTAAAFCVTR